MTDEEQLEAAPAAVEPTCVGDLVRVTRRSVLVSYPRKAPPAHAIGAQEAFAVSMNGSDVRQASGRVIYWSLKGDRELYCYEVDEFEASFFKAAGQRKRSLRVTPDRPMFVQAACGGTVVQGEIKDVSSTGISILFETEVEAALGAALGRAGEWRLAIEFTLPGNDGSIQHGGRVLYRVIAGQRVKYGVEFGSTTESDADPQHISEHLLNYQSEIIRRVQH